MFGILGLIFTIASTVVGAVSEIARARTERQQAKAEAAEAEREAAFEERRSRRRAAQIIGQQRAMAGAAGVDPSSGSPLLLEIDSVREAELEAQNIRQGGRAAVSAARRRASYYGGQSILAGVGGGLRAGSILTEWTQKRSGGGRMSRSTFQLGS